MASAPLTDDHGKKIFDDFANLIASDPKIELNTAAIHKVVAECLKGDEPTKKELLDKSIKALESELDPVKLVLSQGLSWIFAALAVTALVAPLYFRTIPAALRSLFACFTSTFCAASMHIIYRIYKRIDIVNRESLKELKGLSLQNPTEKASEDAKDFFRFLVVTSDPYRPDVRKMIAKKIQQIDLQSVEPLTKAFLIANYRRIAV